MAFIGLIVAAPIGPVSLLCIQRTLNYGLLVGLACGLGIAAADAVFGALAVFSITEITNLLIKHKEWIAIIGGIYLIYLGIKPIFDKKKKTTASSKPMRKNKNEILLFFTITLTNPMTILTFAAAYSSIMLTVPNNQNDILENIYAVLGIFFGSLVWWILLCGLISILHKKLTDNAIMWMNKIFGLSLLTFGILIILKIYWER